MRINCKENQTENIKEVIIKIFHCKNAVKKVKSKSNNGGKIVINK